MNYKRIFSLLSVLILVLAIGIPSALADVPVVTDVSIYPAEVANISPNIDDFIFVNVTCTHPTNETLTAGILLYVDGVLDDNVNVTVNNDTSITVGTWIDYLVIGDVWIAYGYCVDDVEQTEWAATNATVTIQNRLPVLILANTTPLTPFSNEHIDHWLTCTDPDWPTQDIEGWLHVWNGTNIFSSHSNLSMPNATVTLMTSTNSENTVLGQEWIGQFKCGDGIVNTTDTNVTATITNTLPIIYPALSWIPGDAYYTYNQTVYGGCQDINQYFGEQSLTFFIQPYTNGAPGTLSASVGDNPDGVQTSENTLIWTQSAATISPGQVWVFEVWCGDDVANSTKSNITRTIYGGSVGSSGSSGGTPATVTPVTPTVTEPFTVTPTGDYFGMDKTTVYIIAFLAIGAFVIFAYQKRWF